MGLLIGLTGGIASGKSTVAARLADKQIPIIDTDRLSRELVEPGQPALNTIAEAFGPSVIQPDQQLDRAALRARILDDATARARLEAILHPPIRQLAHQRALTAAADHPYVIVVIPLLAEKNVYPHYRWLDGIVNVTTSPDQQRARLLARPGLNTRQAEQLLNAQTTDEQRRQIADFCLENVGDLNQLHNQVDELHHALLKRAGAP